MKYTYEDKCRKCGSVNEIYVCDSNQMSSSDFNKMMVDKTNSPRCYHCKKCKKDTVKDVIAYGLVKS